MGSFWDFDEIIKSMGELPPSPIVATKLLELLRQPDLKTSELANAVSLDPVISGRVLRMANSAFYGQQRQVKAVDRAIIVVGQNVLKELALEYSLRSTQKTYGLLERRLWENSIGCAVASRMIAERLTEVDKGEAYLAGLQHHIGKVLMINRDKDLYKEVMAIVDAGKGVLRDVECGFFAYSHDLVGAALLDFWNYPKVVVAVAQHHHRFEKLRESDEEAFLLCAIVNLASSFCRYFGVGQPKRDETLDLTMNRGALALEANPLVVEELLEKFYPNFIKERNLFLS